MCIRDRRQAGQYSSHPPTRRSSRQETNSHCARNLQRCAENSSSLQTEQTTTTTGASTTKQATVISITPTITQNLHNTRTIHQGDDVGGRDAAGSELSTGLQSQRGTLKNGRDRNEDHVVTREVTERRRVTKQNLPFFGRDDNGGFKINAKGEKIDVEVAEVEFQKEAAHRRRSQRTEADTERNSVRITESDASLDFDNEFYRGSFENSRDVTFKKRLKNKMETSFENNNNRGAEDSLSFARELHYKRGNNGKHSRTDSEDDSLPARFEEHIRSFKEICEIIKESIDEEKPKSARSEDHRSAEGSDLTFESLLRDNRFAILVTQRESLTRRIPPQDPTQRPQVIPQKLFASNNQRVDLQRLIEKDDMSPRLKDQRSRLLSILALTYMIDYRDHTYRSSTLCVFQQQCSLYVFTL
eukprot:TRINITY_DN11649_c0_g1_i2.p1 TRINITY_DN11649_c0_g1~~TRINITY_DN11649_c0_g1_i2.p1  ORF type:complete len:441 (-),score=68.24 TRINITY_DN11649_c0_g1_i2:200-1441(-)